MNQLSYVLIFLVVYCGCNRFTSELTPNKERWIWARQAGGSGWTYANAIAANAEGRLCVAGFISGRAKFQHLDLSARSEMDAFVSCYEKDGALVWVRHFGVTGSSNIEDLAIDDTGTIYVAGSTSEGVFDNKLGHIVFGRDHIQGKTRRDPSNPLDFSADFFLAALDSEGNAEWAIRDGSDQDTRPADIALGRDGSVYVAGLFQGEFGDTGVISKGGKDIFLAKYDSVGQRQWIRAAGGSGDDEATSVASDHEGNIFMVGHFERDATFGNVELRSDAVREFFLVKYDSGGHMMWLRSGKTEGLDPDAPLASYGEVHGLHQGASFAYDVETTPDGRGIYVAGSFRGAMFWRDTTIASLPGGKLGQVHDDAFLAKFDSTGKRLWLRTGGGSTADFASGVTTDALGNVYITGDFHHGAMFGDLELKGNSGPRTGGREAYVARYLGNGDMDWAVQTKGPAGMMAKGKSIVWTNAGECVIAGLFDGEVHFGDIALSGLPARNMFVAKLDCSGEGT